MVVRLLKQNRKLNLFLSWRAESQEGCTVTVHDVSLCRSAERSAGTRGAPGGRVPATHIPGPGVRAGWFQCHWDLWHHLFWWRRLASLPGCCFLGLQWPAGTPLSYPLQGHWRLHFPARQVVISLGPAVWASSTAHELCLPTTQRQPEETQHSTRVPTGSGSSSVMQMQPPLFLELGPNSRCQQDHSPVFLAPCPHAAVLSACPCSHPSFWDTAHALEAAHGSLIPTGALAKALTPADDWTPISAVLSTSTPSLDTGLRTWCVVQPGSNG